MNIIKDMQKVRDYCSLGRKLRAKLNIPVSYPLDEIQFNDIELPKDYWYLIRNELNVDNVNPFICHSDNEKWETITENDKTVSLRIDLFSQFEERYKVRKQNRLLMANKKNEHILLNK